MFANYQLPPSDQITAETADRGLQIAPGLVANIDGDLRHIELRAEDGLQFAFTDVPDRAGWLELALDLSDPAWLRCTHIYLSIRASSQQERSLRPCLRFQSDTGFHDHFSNDSFTFHETLSDAGTCLTLPPRFAQDAHSLRLQIFFEPKSDVFHLNHLALTGVV